MNPATTKALRVTGKVLKILLYVFVSLLLLDTFVGIIIPILIPVIGGPYLFLSRTLPKIEINPGAVAFFVVTLILLTVGSHHFLDWLYQYENTNAPEQPRAPAPWRRRWTLLLISGLFLTFVTTMSLVGMAHQIGWLARSKEPWLRSRYRWVYFLRFADQMREELVKTGWNSTKAAELIAKKTAAPETTRYFIDDTDSVEYSLVTDVQGNLLRVILIPRDSKEREQLGLMNINQDGVKRILLTDLQKYLDPAFKDPAKN